MLEKMNSALSLSHSVDAGKSPRKELQPQGPSPTPLRVHKDSHKIKKPPIVPQPASQPPSQQPYLCQQPRQPVIISTMSSKVIHIDVSDFMDVVQRKTGLNPSSSSSPPTKNNPNNPPNYDNNNNNNSRDDQVMKTSSAQDVAEGMEMDGDDGVVWQKGSFLGILSSGPASLNPIPSNFSPPPDSFFHDLSSLLHGNRNSIEGVDGVTDTLQLINDSSVSQRGPFAQQHSSRPVNQASTSEVSCREPKLGVADKTLRKVVSVMGNAIKNILLNTSLERLPSFKDELGKLLTTLDNVGEDVSSLRANIDAFMVTAIDYYSAQSTYSQKLSLQIQRDRLAAVDHSLSFVLAMLQAEEVHYVSKFESIKSANARMKELKREQEQLELELCQLNESFSRSDAQLSQYRSEVTRLRDDKIAIEKIPVLSTADAETLDELRVSFERLHNGFKDLSWE